MSLGGISVTWDSTKPSVTSQAGVGYQDLQSIKSTMQQVLDSEHVFESTGGSNTGIHRKGSAIAFVGTASAVSSTDTDGRMMVTSNTSRLYHVGSSVTMFLGGRYAIEATPSGNTLNGVNFPSKVTQVTRVETGTFLMTSTGTTLTLQNNYISSTACAIVTPILSLGSININTWPLATAPSGTQLTVYAIKLDGTGQSSTGTYTYYCNYIVMGTVAG